MKAKSRFSSNALFSALILAVCPVQAGSLWKDGVTDERGMFADKRGRAAWATS